MSSVDAVQARVTESGLDADLRKLPGELGGVVSFSSWVITVGSDNCPNTSKVDTLIVYSTLGTRLGILMLDSMNTSRQCSSLSNILTPDAPSKLPQFKLSEVAVSAVIFTRGAEGGGRGACPVVLNAAILLGVERFPSLSLARTYT